MISSPPTLFAALFMVGACMGSFINLVALRHPACRDYPDQSPPNLMRPGSRCPNCLTPLRPYHNIPLLSFALLSGRCGYCRSHISIRYPVVELATALICVINGLVYGPGWGLLAALVFSQALLALSLIDLDHRLLPDNIVLPLLWTGLLINCTGLFTDLQSALLGAVAGYLVPWSIYQIHHRLTGRQGIGYGDFKLLACIGAWLGWQMLPAVISIASITALLFVGGSMIARKRTADQPISFGPWLALAAWLIMLWSSHANPPHPWLFNL